MLVIDGHQLSASGPRKILTLQHRPNGGFVLRLHGNVMDDINSPLGYTAKLDGQIFLTARDAAELKWNL